MAIIVNTKNSFSCFHSYKIFSIFISEFAPYLFTLFYKPFLSFSELASYLFTLYYKPFSSCLPLPHDYYSLLETFSFSLSLIIPLFLCWICLIFINFHKSIPSVYLLFSFNFFFFSFWFPIVKMFMCSYCCKCHKQFFKWSCIDSWCRRF